MLKKFANDFGADGIPVILETPSEDGITEYVNELKNIARIDAACIVRVARNIFRNNATCIIGLCCTYDYVTCIFCW